MADRKLLVKVDGDSSGATDALQDVKAELNAVGDKGAESGARVSTSMTEASRTSQEAAKETQKGFAKAFEGMTENGRELRRGFDEIGKAIGLTSEQASTFGRIVGDIAQGDWAGAIMTGVLSATAAFINWAKASDDVKTSVDEIVNGIKVNLKDALGQQATGLKEIADRQRKDSEQQAADDDYFQVMQRDSDFKNMQYKANMQAEYQIQDITDRKKREEAYNAIYKEQLVKLYQDKHALDEQDNAMELANQKSLQLAADEKLNEEKAQDAVRHSALKRMYGDAADMNDLYLTNVQRATEQAQAAWNEAIAAHETSIRIFHMQMKGIVDEPGNIVRTVGNLLGGQLEDWKEAADERKTIAEELAIELGPTGRIGKLLRDSTFGEGGISIFDTLRFDVESFGSTFGRVMKVVEQHSKSAAKETHEIQDEFKKLGEGFAQTAAHSIAMGTNFGQAIRQMLKSEEEWALTKMIESLGMAAFDVATMNYGAAASALEAAALFGAVAGGTAALSSVGGSGPPANSNYQPPGSLTGGGGGAGGSPVTVIFNVGNQPMTQKQLGDVLAGALNSSYLAGGAMRVASTSTTVRRRG